MLHCCIDRVVLHYGYEGQGGWGERGRLSLMLHCCKDRVILHEDGPEGWGERGKLPLMPHCCTDSDPARQCARRLGREGEVTPNATLLYRQ